MTSSKKLQFWLRRPHWLGAVALVIASLASTAHAEDAGLTIATWSGAYGQSQQQAYFQPFTEETGTEITIATYDGSFDAIKVKLGEDPAPYDVVDLSSGSLDRLCRDGMLEAVDAASLGPSEGNVADDFLAGGLSSCGVASMAWAMVLIVDRQAFPKTVPTKIADLLDLKNFPGKRALPNGPRYTLELALLADGVAPDQVYAELATPVGTDRAFAALDKIKAETVWWNKPTEPIALLASKKAAIAAGYSGRIFHALAGSGDRMDLLWDGQIYDTDVWAVPKTAPNKDAAKRFISFAAAPERLAAQARLIAYGPMRKSAIPLVGKHPDIGVEMMRFLPTAPENFKNALKFDEAWWNEHGGELIKRFETWRELAATTQGAAPDSKPAQPQ
ncbi:MAG TPA: ABC transporter substrate-binding protein [Methyloceanibacter sp.]|jgi:putative spermidine/putrescine transport system substrate-binding protein